MSGHPQQEARKGFTDRELNIMSVLWSRGSGTVAAVREALEGDVG